MTTREQGIVERHSTYCPTRQGGRCSAERTTGRRCRPTFRAWVYSRSARKKILSEGFGTLAEARSWRTKALAELERGRLAPRAGIKLREFAADWLDGIEAGTILTRSGEVFKPKTARGYRADLEGYVLAEFGGVKLGDLRKATVQAFVDKLVGRGCSAAKIHNVIVPLKALCRYAVERDLIWINPTTNVRLPVDRSQRERAVGAGEAAELIAALDPEDRPVWATAVYAGLRLGELRALRWLDVDLAGGLIRVERSWDEKVGPIAPKSRSGVRRIPLVPLLRDYLLEAKTRTGREGEQLVFGSTASTPFTPSNIRRRAARAWERANAERIERGQTPLEPVRLHECRHSFVSMMVASGASLDEVGDYVGHSSIWMVSRYRHLLAGQEQVAADRFAEYLARGDTSARLAQLDRTGA